MTWRNWISGLVIAASCGLVSPARAADSAVVLMYHRVGTPSASTNTPVEMFKDHLRLLRSEKYAVLPLTTVLASLRGGDPLPDRTIVITFDNAYRRLTETAIPLLLESGLPFTVFVSTDGVDQGTKDLMTWEQLRKLAEEGVEIASNGAGFINLGRNSEATAVDVKRSVERLTAELGAAPKIIGYPWGQITLETRELVQALGFIAGFGQHSGALSAGADPYYLPRFPLSKRDGAQDRFALILNSKPLPITGMTPAEDGIDTADPIAVMVELDGTGKMPGDIGCFATGAGRLAVARTAQGFTVTVPGIVKKGGHRRLNCTARHADGFWYWLGRRFWRKG